MRILLKDPETQNLMIFECISAEMVQAVTYEDNGTYETVNLDGLYVINFYTSDDDDIYIIFDNNNTAENIMKILYETGICDLTYESQHTYVNPTKEDVETLL